MTTTTTRKPRASRAASKAQADQQQPQAQEQPKPAQTAASTKTVRPKLGPDGYRAKFGVSTDALVSAVRVHFEVSSADIADAEIVAGLGWSYTEASAFKRIGALLVEREAAAQA